jgi:hypothetical protein
MGPVPDRYRERKFMVLLLPDKHFFMFLFGSKNLGSDPSKRLP